jgi:hypothetical protein
MSYVLAKTVTGSLLTFNTKAQTGRNSDIYCELVRVQPPLVIQPEAHVVPGAQVDPLSPPALTLSIADPHHSGVIEGSHD